jgi:hypothetical protein
MKITAKFELGDKVFFKDGDKISSDKVSWFCLGKKGSHHYYLSKRKIWVRSKFLYRIKENVK